MKKKSLIFALVLSATLAGGVLRPAMADYANIKEAIQDSANPRTYTLNGSETITSNLGSMGGDGSTLTIDAASPDYSIIGKNGSTQYNGVTVNSGQTLILQNIGKATISDTDYSISDVAGIQNLRQAIINNGTLTIENVVFNKLVSQTSAAIINNANAKITNITGKFLNSGNLDKPPVIYSSAKSSIIERISADFINNKGNQGGAISTMNGGTIDKIVNSRFILNEAKRAAGAIRNGEALNNYGGTVNIESSEFKYNYSRAEGGAIVNDYSDAVAGSVMTIKNSVFENNFNVADKTGYGGGAIFHNGKLLELTDTNFKDNITHGDGGALLLNSLTYINADNSDVKFSGNKSKVASISNFNGLNTTYTDGSNTRYNDIYLREGNLYLNANANKSITFDGTLENDSSKNNALFINSDSTIKGGVYNFNNSVSAKNLNIFNDANVKFGSAAQADGTTSYGSLNTQDFTNDTNGGTLDFLNSHIESNTLGNANLNGILNTKIDVDFTNAQSDSFKITGGIGGTINIGAIHFIDENISTNVEKTITILDDSVDKVDLTRTSYPNPEVIGTKETKVLDVKPTAYWDEKFDDIIYSQDVKGAIVLHNSYGDKKDSIKVTVNGFGDSTPIGRVASDKDTLAALNKYVTTEDRAFTANTSSPNYTATEDLGETTAGKFTISGVDGSVLNLGSHTGFELANETTLNLNSLELTGSNPAIAVSNSNAKVNINDVKLNSDITGTTNFDLTTTGDNTVSATITKANIINSGDLTVTKNNAFSAVNLQSSGGSLNLSSGRVESQNFGKVVLSGDTNFAVDADLANVVSDNISATEFEGSGYFSINKINILSDSVVETVRTLVANDVLKAHVKLATTVDITRPSAKDYVITYDDGYLTFTNENPNFVKIARNNAISRSYNMKADVNIANDIADIGDSSTSIGTMGGNVGAEFTVNGNNSYSIDGAGKGGIIIGSGRTLNVNNVGSLNTDGTVKAAWKGFNDAIFTLNSDGVLNFMGENVIANNSTTASKNIITNIAGKVNFSEGAKLNLIDNTYGSSLIYNYDGTVGNINGIIDRNKINKNNNYYGLIYNGSSDADKISKMGDISGTISNNTLKGTNVYGGTIINISKGTSEIGNISADITGNSVTASTGLYGGLIRNESEGGNLKIGDISGKIKNNSLVTNSVIYGALISNKATNGGNAEIGEISSTITNNTISSNSSNQETTGLISNEGNSNGLSNISAITGDILNNTLNLASRRLLGGLVYNFAKTYTASIGDISGKLNNNIINVNGTNGGVIFNGAEGAYNSEIADVTGKISGNKITSVGGNSINGGLIYNYSKSTGVAKMGDISANITDNIVTAESLVTGGLLYNCKGSSTIEGVSGNVSGNTVITSGEIEGGLINNEGSIGLISGDFTNNYIESTANKVNGGLIYNESGSRAVLTSDITGNYIKSAKPSESNGAVLGNMASMTIKDSSITNNASNMLNTISNRGTLNIIADTKDVLFEGNKVKATINRDESTGEVTVSGGEEIDIRNTSNGVLNLYTSQGKTITFNGAITDENNLGTTKVGGTYNDGTGETAYAGNVIFNNTVTQKTLNINNGSNVVFGVNGSQYGELALTNLKNDSNGGLIDSLNDHIERHTIGKANLSSALDIAIDMSIETDLSSDADTFTLTAGNAGTGTLNISNLSITGDGIDKFKQSTVSTEIIQKILNNANANTKLTLSDSVKAEYDTVIADETITGVKEFSGTTIKYNEDYGGYEFIRSRETEMSVIGSSSGLLDSIKWAIVVTDGERTYTDKYDNLYLINVAEGAERTFDFDGTTATFTSIKNAGTTAAGKLTILGTKDGDNYSIIDADTHSLFNMTNADTTVEIQNTKIINASSVANVSDGNELILNNSIIDESNTAGISNDGKLTLKNTNEINQTVTGTGVTDVTSGKTTLGASLTQKEVNILSGAALEANANNIIATDGIQNKGDLYLTGGTTQSIISGENGALHIQGAVTVVQAITDNVISLEPTSNSGRSTINMGITSLENITTNGGDINLQYQNGTEDYSFGNVVLTQAAGMSIDLDLTGSNPVKTADNISATNVTGSDKIYINHLNITVPTSADTDPTYAKVADNVLKEKVDLGDNNRAHVDNIPQNGFIITYAKDSAGANTGGFLQMAYTDLVSAARATASSRVYIMGVNDEDIVSQLNEHGGSGITDSSFPFGGSALSVNGAGTQSIVGGGSTGGFVIGDGQTLSLNNIKEVKGFSTGIENNGTVNITDTDFTGNTTDIQNNNILNLYGTDSINTITGNNGTVNVKSYNEPNGDTVNADVTLASGGSISQKAVVVDENNILNVNSSTFTVTDGVTNNGTLNLKTTGTISLVQGTGSTEVKDKTITINSLTQDAVTVSGGKLNAGNVSTSSGVTNNISGGLNLIGGTIDSSITGTSGTTTVSGNVVVRYLNSFDNTNINTLSQAVTVEKTGSLNANVASIGAAITVNAEGTDVGSVTLYSQEANGGDLNYAVTGDGTANFNRNVNVKADVTTKTINVATYNDGSTDYNANVVVADGNQFGVEGGTISVDSGNTLTMNNADNLAADTSNQGTLNLLNGTISKDIDGTGGTTFIKGDVTLASTIKENTISVESDAVANLMTSADIKDAAKFIANGGDLNLQKESSTDAFNLGKVDLQKNMALAIDVDLSHDDGEYNKKADNISASNVSGSANILINNIKISADSNDVIPAYAKVADAKLKGNVNIADDTKVIVPSISGSGPKDSFMITYATDVDGEGGFLKFEYSDLVNAVKSETKTKAYVMTDDENVNEDLMPLGGESLSVSGNGNKITGQGTTKGIAPVKGGQTLSINNVSEMSGFDTAISNKAGTVNLENVTMTGNTVDVQNNKNLNLKGTDVFDTIVGEGDTVISTYTDEDGNKVKGDVTVNKELTQDKVTLDSSDDKLTNNGTANINNLDNNGTVDNSGTLNIKDGNNKGSITGDDGEMNIDGNFVNDSDITQESVNVGEDADLTNNGDIDSESFTNNGNTDNDSDGTISADKITNNGTLTTDASNLISKNDKPVTNDGSLDFTSGTNKNDIDGNGKTIVSGDVENTGNVNNDVTVNSDASLNNNAGSLGGDGKTVTNNGTLTNDGNISGTTVNNGSATNNGNIDGKVVNNNKLDNNLSITGDVTNNSDGKIANNSGGSIVGNLNNKGTVDNKGNIIAGNGKSVNNSGTINNTGNLNGNINNKKQGVINTTMKGLDGEVTNRGNIHYTTSGDMRQDIMGDGTIHLDGKGTTKLNADIDGNTLSLNNGNLMFDSNKDISKGGFIANGGNIVGVADGKINTYKLGNTKMAKDAGVDGIDFNLSNLTSDKFIGNFSGNGKFNIDNVRIQGNTLESHIKVSLSDTTNIPDNNLSVKAQKLPDILTPIMWLKGSIEDNYLIYQGRGGGYSDFNPAIMASSVAAHVGGYNAQLEAFEHGFYHMNRYTKYASADRLAAENYNKVASADTASHTVAPQPINPLTEEAIWTKPYTSWESVHLKHGPHVDSFAYGNFFGGDTDLVDIGYGFKGVLSAFIGYNGNHMSYDGVSMDMQGGTLGVTGTAYKGNFFTGLTASTGASGVEAYTSYGTDHFGMINAGVASKSGYNWEIKGGRLIVQPTLLIGYTFVNTFDYKNAAGAKIESDPYSALQIMPELKVIGNTEKGWQPYAKVGMVYNIGLGNRTMTANDVKLPQLSNKPYVQYGVGIQRSWAGRFTAFLETLLRGGGRNGVMLFGGFRWTIGSDGSKPNSKQSNGSNKTIIKANDTLVVPNDSGELQPLPNVNGAVDFEDNIQPAVNKVDNSTISASETKVVIKKYQPNKKKFLWF